jgi:polyisoprenoid-binding protein YceI
MKAILGLAMVAALSASPAANAECWMPVAAAGRIAFTARQAGAAFRGEFKSYSGQVCLAENPGSQNRIRVSVQTGAVDSRLPELDDALRGPEFFDVRHWPQATFESEAVSAVGKGRYEVTGKLTIRDITRSVTVPFTWTPQGDGSTAKLEARTTIMRLDYGVGTGQWADTRWVDNAVELVFSLTMRRAPAE